MSPHGHVVGRAPHLLGLRLVGDDERFGEVRLERGLLDGLLDGLAARGRLAGHHRGGLQGILGENGQSKTRVNKTGFDLGEPGFVRRESYPLGSTW